MALNYLGKTKLHKIVQHLKFDVPAVRYCKYTFGRGSEWLKFTCCGEHDLGDENDTCIEFSIWHRVSDRVFGVRTALYDDVECRYIRRSWELYEGAEYEEIIAALETMLEAAKKPVEEIDLPFPEVLEEAEQPQAVSAKAHDVEMPYLDGYLMGIDAEGKPYLRLNPEAVEAADAELEEVCNESFEPSEPIEVYDMTIGEAKAAFEDCKKCLVNPVSLSFPDFLYWTDRFKSLSLHIYLLEQEQEEQFKKDWVDCNMVAPAKLKS